MRAAISVIIPTLNAEVTLPGCAAGLFEGVQEGLLRELIVSDGGSGDNTQAIAEELGAEFVRAGAERRAQMQRGAEVARGDWLLFLPPESQLQPGWTDAVKAHMSSQMAAVFRLEGGSVAARLAAGWRSAFGGTTAQQGLLVRALDYARAGGHDADGRVRVPRPLLLSATVRRSVHG
ncbi:glycosyltransferase [Pseudooceanicola spongiae]|uniref:Glycosyltransferase n=1 Tax=Pseudooceanicola spongiae TaxID=2613965 RepID=A0A7L9WMC9_9RHOB|nr:glycosyltransferase [Pseudooceanicola spongiae]QOL81082.1 glycosyltransferase [Pseudooceanicola spongiae]